jgi:hypothetical protein
MAFAVLPCDELIERVVDPVWVLGYLYEASCDPDPDVFRRARREVGRARRLRSESSCGSIPSPSSSSSGCSA